MQSIACMGLLVAVLSTASIASARAPYTIPSARPASIREVKEVLRGGGAKPPIPEYLEETQCGGWDKEINVGATGEITSGFISTVWGVPGRKHWWAGDIRSGMGARFDSDDDGDSKDDEYEYPNGADGLGTACEQGKNSIQKDVWEFKENWDSWNPATDDFIEWIPEFELKKHTYQYPFFRDPACRWRMENNTWPPWPLQPDAEILPSDKNSIEYEEPPSCYEFCQYLNSFVYEDCLNAYETNQFWTRVGVDIFGQNQYAPLTVWTCDPKDQRGLKYICTDERVDNGDRLRACDEPHPDPEEWSNARKCIGDQCRCGEGKKEEGGEEANDACVHVKNDDKKAPYQSYYRHYSGVGYNRSQLAQHVPNDVSTKNMDLACYGFYKEFDPKFHRTEDKDRRCVINVNVEDMRESQKGKGEYKESDVQDTDPTQKRNQRPGGTKGAPTASGNFDPEKDTWYKKLGGAFSFVNEKVFKKRYDSDLANVYLDFDSLDDGKHKAAAQISNEYPVQLFAESNLMRAFDDTGNPRAYTRWWQEQQTRMAAIMRAPVLRIVLPSAWFMGLDPDDPFLTARSGTEDATERADRSDRIELQIEADEDILGTALAYIERSVLLHVEEEPIPVIVPMGSPAEFRARAADWCAWYRTTTGDETCDSAPEDVKKVMERLEDYAQRIDDVRELRAELALSAGALLELQSELLKPIATWFKENETTLRGLIRGRERAERELLPAWQRAQRTVVEMHERSNLPWCMNQRFTAPVLSMLDPWLPSRGIRRKDANGKDIPLETSELGLPRLPIVQRSEDAIIDFSAVAAMSGTIKIPVLKPVQIRIDIPTPPTPGPLAELPDIQALRDAMKDVIGKMPRVVDNLDNASMPDPPPALSETFLSEARTALMQTESVVRGMNDRYKKFWASIGPLKPLDPEDPGFEEAKKEKERKERLQCKDWNTNQCQHVEMDLWERIQRIGSRPLVQLKHDFASIGTPRTEPTVCLPEDDACHILNAERTDPGFRWELRGSRANDAPIDALKLQILELTQPPPLGSADPLLLEPHDDDPAPLQSFPRIQLLP